jgi:hypothetical protein
MGYCAGLTARRIELFSGPGTRRWPRFGALEVPRIKGIKSDAEPRIRIVNVSRGGALLITRRRLARGLTIQLDLSLAEGIIVLTGLVLRSSVSFLRGIRQWQAAVAFDRPLEIFANPLAPIADDSRSSLLKSPPFRPFPSEFGASLYEPDHCGNSPMIAAFLAISFCNASDAALDEMGRLNDW